jgi:hypothetical protein
LFVCLFVWGVNKASQEERPLKSNFSFLERRMLSCKYGNSSLDNGIYFTRTQAVAESAFRNRGGSNWNFRRGVGQDYGCLRSNNDQRPCFERNSRPSVKAQKFEFLG